jgi:hypothetical protein
VRKFTRTIYGAALENIPLIQQEKLIPAKIGGNFSGDRCHIKVQE